MPITQIIDPISPVPDIADPATFETRANTLLTNKLPTLAAQINALVTQFNAVAAEVQAEANTWAGALGAANKWYPLASASDPTQRPDGTAVQEGDIYFNSTLSVFKTRFLGVWQVVNVNTAALAASSGATLIGYQSRSVDDRLRDVMSVLDGMTATQIADVRAGTAAVDVTAAVQATINAAGATKTLEWPAGTYLCGELTFPNGIDWRGRGATLKCPPGATVANNWIRAAGTKQGGSIEGITFDYQGNANGKHILELGANARNWRILRNTFKNMKGRNAIRADWAVAVAGDGYIEVRGNSFIGGQSAGSLAFLAQLPNMGIRDITFTDNQVIDCGGSMCTIRNTQDPPDPAGNWGTFVNVTLSNNRLVGNGTGDFGPIPVELWGCDNVTIVGNAVDQATRGIGFAWCRNVTCSVNAISNQTFYAHEVGMVDGLLVSGETIKNCKRFIFEDSGGVGLASKNISVVGNIIDGSGMTVAEANVYALQFTAQTTAGLYHTNVLIANNRFANLTYHSGAVRLVAVRGALMSVNKFVRTAELEGVTLVRLTDSADCTITGNEARLSGPYTANTPVFDSAPGVITPSPSSLADGNVIEKNIIASSISSFAGSGVVAIGAVTAPSDFKTLRIAGNVLSGPFTQIFFINDTGGFTVLRDNDDRAASETTPSTTAVAYARLRHDYDVLAMPTSGFYRQGSRALKRNCAIGQPQGWARLTTGSSHVLGTDWAALPNL